MKQYYWYKCVTSLDNPAGVSGVEAANWKPPKEAFKYYKSASLAPKVQEKSALGGLGVDCGCRVCRLEKLRHVSSLQQSHRQPD